jgi:hypothetical protein
MFRWTFVSVIFAATFMLSIASSAKADHPYGYGYYQNGYSYQNGTYCYQPRYVPSPVYVRPVRVYRPYYSPPVVYHTYYARPTLYPVYRTYVPRGYSVGFGHGDRNSSFYFRYQR